MSRFKHPIRIGLAIFFLILGIIGLLLPVVPQTVFLLLAAVLFFPSHPRVEQFVVKIQPKWPRTVALLRRLGVGETKTPEPPRYNPGDPR